MKSTKLLATLAGSAARPLTGGLVAVPMVAGVLVSGLMMLGCRIDPVPQAQIDNLPAEDGPGPNHRQGQPCVLCHSEYEGAEPEMAIGGTIFHRTESQGIVGAPFVLVTLVDSGGNQFRACTNESGNFWITTEDAPTMLFPMTAKAGPTTMDSFIMRDRSCAGCHKLPTAVRPDMPPEMVNADPETGGAFDSAGIILVQEDLNVGNPEVVCGPRLVVDDDDDDGSGGAGGGGGGAGGAGGGE